MLRSSISPHRSYSNSHPNLVVSRVRRIERPAKIRAMACSRQCTACIRLFCSTKRTMVFKRLVQIGRVVFIAKGKDAGKIATVVDVVDGNRVLIDGPSTGVVRCVRNLKDLQLTKFVVKIRVGQRTKGVKEAFDGAKINEQFKKTLWAKKIAQKAVRAKLTDYERFKLMKAKQMRNRLVRVEFAKLRKAAK